MPFWQVDYNNSEYKKQFKEQIEVLKAYNEGVLFGNILGATAREISMLGLNAKTEGGLYKSQVSARGKYLATTFLLDSVQDSYEEQEF